MKKNITLFKDVRMLVVEDCDLNLEVILEMLRIMGIESDAATDGKEAIEKIKDNNYDIILMDIFMPIMDGYETARLIRKLPIKQPIITALTASVQQIDKQKSLDAGMDDFLTKPLTLTDLEIYLKQKLPQKLVKKTSDLQ